MNLYQKGQTLIETLAAAFILVMGVSAAAGLAIFALHSSTAVVKQIIATGLAREGLEAVRNMRDTNWLQDSLVTNGCYDYVTLQNNKASCYTHWMGTAGGTAPYCIDPSIGGCSGNATNQPISYSLEFDASASNLWNLQKQYNQSNFGMTFDPNNGGNTGFYYSDGNTSCSDGSNMADYCRKIILTKINNAEPYNHDTNLVLLQVQSQVWWVDQKCPRASDFSSAPTACRVELDTFLTNWKNYR